jgi:O-methyltransferase
MSKKNGGYWASFKSFYVEHRNIFHIKYYQRYKEFTMVRANEFADNLILVKKFSHVPGIVVECGVWRGGMSAAIADVLDDDTREYFLFDSFEGLPDAKEIDGESALEWQQNTLDPRYFDNCTAEMGYAEKAMRKAGCTNFKLVKGWFSETLPLFKPEKPIAILRLDGDWYDSTMECLVHLYPKVQKGGLILIDDYYIWDGCSRAVHDYLSRNSLADRIFQSKEGVCYIVKR